MMLYRPENTNIDRGEASVNIDSPQSILIFSGRYHIISNASLVNNCIILFLKYEGIKVKLVF